MLRQLTRLLRFGLIVLITAGITFSWSPRAVGQLPDLQPASGVSLNVPRGVDRYGQIEATWVKSPIDNRQLFEIAAPTVERTSDSANALAVEVRAEEITARLWRVVRRFESATGSETAQAKPQVTIGVLNNRPILLVEGEGSRPLRLITVTDVDAEFSGQQADELAASWQLILQDEVERLLTLLSPETLLKRIGQALQILLGLIVASGVLYMLRRLAHRRQQTLKTRQEAHQSDAVQRQTDLTESDGGNNTHEERLTHLLSTLRQQFSLRRRIDFYTQLKWIIFWLFVLVWYLGSYFIASHIPILVRYSGWILTIPLEIVVLWFLVSLALRISQTIIERLTHAWQHNAYLSFGEVQRRVLRTSTISGALAGLITVLLYAVGIIGTLNILNVPTGSVLAGGAIIGLAISFGSQSLVKDVVNGCLILAEDQFAEGDVIDLGHVGGAVENLNLRVTQLRNAEGQLITIPNSAISEVRNLTRLWSRVDFSIEVAYNNDPKKVMSLLNTVAQKMYNEPEWHDRISVPPEVLGIDHLSHGGMLIRVWIKTAPAQQWAIGREFRLRVRQAFDEHQIRIGRPERITYNIPFEDKLSPNEKEVS